MQKKIISKIGSILLFYIFFSSAIASGNDSLTDTYYGTATITTPAEMASVDLAFNLDITDTTIQHDTSYILLDKTMLFPAVSPQIDGVDVGPRVNGTISPDQFSLTSDIFHSEVGELSVSRQITLNQATVSNEGKAITGTYTETITGLLPQDVIISGDFFLVKPVSPSGLTILDSNDDGCFNVDEIRAAGNDPDLMEFNDAGAALSIYNGDGTISICTPAEENIQTILQEFYDSRN